MNNKQMCDEEFNKYFEEETNKQTFNIKMEEPMKLIINYDYYFLLLKKLERLESKIKMLEKYKDDYKRMKDNFDAKVEVVENLHKKIIKTIEHLKIKQARLINEKDYVITNLDLDEIMQDLESKGE